MIFCTSHLFQHVRCVKPAVAWLLVVFHLYFISSWENVALVGCSLDHTVLVLDLMFSNFSLERFLENVAEVVLSTFHFLFCCLMLMFFRFLGLFFWKDFFSWNAYYSGAIMCAPLWLWLLAGWLLFFKVLAHSPCLMELVQWRSWRRRTVAYSDWRKPTTMEAARGGHEWKWRALARANISGSWLSLPPLLYCLFFFFVFALASSHHCFFVDILS